MPGLVEARVLHEKFKFLVESPRFGGTAAAFNKCSELEMSVEVVQYREGGRLIPYKVPGLVSFSDVTLERGTSDNQQFFTWVQDVATVAGGGGGTGAPAPAFREDLSIRQLRRDNAPTRIWDLYGAWPPKFVAGSWDNDANEVTMESLTLTFDFFDPASD